MHLTINRLLHGAIYFVLLCYVYCTMIRARRFLHSYVASYVLRHSFRYVLSNVLCVVLHILRNVLCRIFFLSCSCEVIVPRLCATACLCISSSRCVGNSVLGLAFKCRPIYYHPMFPTIRLIYRSKFLKLYIWCRRHM